MTYKEHAKREFQAAGWLDGNGEFNDDMQKLICTQVMDLLDIFDTHGHSGSSAPYAIGLFKKLASFKPIVPLTGEDWEWKEIGENKYQNIRCSEVFKDGDRAYNIYGKVFTDKDGCNYTSGNSHVDISFPYTPKTEHTIE